MKNAIFNLFTFAFVFVFTSTIKAETIYYILEQKNLDISSKSYLGWTRVLNNPDKRKEYKLDDLPPVLIAQLTEELKTLAKQNSFEGKLK